MWHGRRGQARHRRAPSARRGRWPGGGRPLQRQPLVRVGPLPLRARVGHRARGLQRARRRVELVPPRPRAVARLPLERGRDGRPLRHPPRAVPGPVAVERRRPDPQGADVRPDRSGGQPRRGRQGVLVVPRRPAEPLAAALALPLPAGRLPLPAPHRRERAPRPRGPRVRAHRHGRLRGRPVLGRRGHLRQGLPDRRPRDDHRGEPRPRRGHDRRAAHACGSATGGGGTPTSPCRPCAWPATRSSSRTIGSPATASRRRPGRTESRPARCSATTRPTRPASTAARR